MAVSNDQARRALQKLAEHEAASRRISGRIIAKDGRHVTLIPDGGGQPLRAYRGSLVLDVGQRVEVERLPMSNTYKCVGASREVAETPGGTYDVENPGYPIYLPVALEAINHGTYALGADFDINLYNVMIVVNGDVWQTPFQTIDLTDDIPVSGLQWSIIYQDISDGSFGTYTEATTDDPPEPEWPTYVNNCVIEDRNRVPLLAVLLEDVLTSTWTSVYAGIGRAYPFGDKRIIRVPYYTKERHPVDVIDLDGLAGPYTTSSTSFVSVDGTNLLLTLDVTSDRAIVEFTGSVTTPGLATGDGVTPVELRLNVLHTDPVAATNSLFGTNGITVAQEQTDHVVPVHMSYVLTGLAPGTHTFALQWRISEVGAAAASLRVNGYGGQFSVRQM